MITMLSYLKINIKVSDIDIKTTAGSNDYRETWKDDRDANSMLAVM